MVESYVEEGDVWDIPIGEDDTGDPLYGLRIRNGYAEEKLSSILKKRHKKQSTCKIFHERFHRKLKHIAPIDVRKCAD